MKTKQIDIVRKNWVKASISLKFKLISPYLIELNGNKIEAFAFLPEYGSPNGAIIGLMFPLKYETDPQIIKWAKENNVFYSFINVTSCLEYNEDYFIGALEDWVKFEANS